MIAMVRSIFTPAICGALALAGSVLPGAASVGLANPAAEFCIAGGGLFGIRDADGGQYGVCVLPSGDEVNAWDHFRAALKEGTTKDNARLTNPAATYCAGIGGTYDLETSACALPDGTGADAWTLLRAAHAKAATLANPAASFCIEQGGAYEIRQGAGGSTGICRFADGTEADAWAFFREHN